MSLEVVSYNTTILPHCQPDHDRAIASFCLAHCANHIRVWRGWAPFDRRACALLVRAAHYCEALDRAKECLADYEVEYAGEIDLASVEAMAADILLAESKVAYFTKKTTVAVAATRAPPPPLPLSPAPPAPTSPPAAAPSNVIGTMFPLPAPPPPPPPPLAPLTPLAPSVANVRQPPVPTRSALLDQLRLGQASLRKATTEPVPSTPVKESPVAKENAIRSHLLASLTKRALVTQSPAGSDSSWEPEPEPEPERPSLTPHMI